MQTGQSSYTLPNTQNSHTVSVSFKTDVANTHALALATIPANGIPLTTSPADITGWQGGNIVPKTLTFKAGTVITVTGPLLVNNSWTAQKWYLDGVEQPDKRRFYVVTVTMDSDHTLSVTYGLGPFVVTATAGLNGSVTPNNSSFVDNGGSITLTATPAAGYVVDGWFLDNSKTPTQSGGNTFTVSNVTDNRGVLVMFKPIPVATQTLTLNSVNPTYRRYRLYFPRRQ